MENATGTEIQIEGATPAVTDTEIEVNATEAEEADETKPEVNDDADDGASDDVLVENEKLKKALKKKNRYTDNLRSRLRAVEAKYESLKSSPETKEAPKIESFDSVMDYMRAENQHFLEQKLGEQQKEQQLSALDQEKAALRAQQDQHITATIEEFNSQNPEFKKVLSEALPVIEAMPKHIEDLMYEIDNAPAAAYALAKEGRLQDLYYMNPYVAAAELVAAQARGLQYLQMQTPVKRPAVSAPMLAQQPTQAPKPMTGVKGSGKTSKSLSDMSADEVVKRFIK